MSLAITALLLVLVGLYAIALVVEWSAAVLWCLRVRCAGCDGGPWRTDGTPEYLCHGCLVRTSEEASV